MRQQTHLKSTQVDSWTIEGQRSDSRIAVVAIVSGHSAGGTAMPPGPLRFGQRLAWLRVRFCAPDCPRPLYCQLSDDPGTIRPVRSAAVHRDSLTQLRSLQQHQTVREANDCYCRRVDALQGGATRLQTECTSGSVLSLSSAPKLPDCCEPRWLRFHVRCLFSFPDYSAFPFEVDRLSWYGQENVLLHHWGSLCRQ